MENTDNIYNYLINKLRDTKPEISDTKELTDTIMNSLQKASVKSVNNYKRIVLWARPVMTAAALFLFGLFIFQQLDETDVPQVSSLAYRENLKPNTIISNCFAEDEQTGNKYKSLFSIYLCYVRQTELANKKFNLILMEQFSKYQIKLHYK
jgi:hypothetical protein